MASRSTPCSRLLTCCCQAGVKNLVVAPTHLMHGAEYDELVAALEPYEGKMNIVVAEPLLGEVGADATVINDDKKAVAEAVVAAAVLPFPRTPPSCSWAMARRTPPTSPTTRCRP